MNKQIKEECQRKYVLCGDLSLFDTVIAIEELIRELTSKDETIATQSERITELENAVAEKDREITQMKTNQVRDFTAAKEAKKAKLIGCGASETEAVG